MERRTRLVYQVPAAVWILLIAWQVVEHMPSNGRPKPNCRTGGRAKDIATTVGLVLGSQRHAITKERLEPALNSLIKPEELNGVAMLNDAGEIVASAVRRSVPQSGAPVPASGNIGATSTFALMNLVALGTNVTSEPESARPTIVVAQRAV